MAVSTFKVTSATLTNKITELETLNNKLSTLKGDFEQEESGLNSKWEGEAKGAFHTTFTQNMGDLDKFYQAVLKYIGTLQGIVGTYETTEATNTSIAGTR